MHIFSSFVKLFGLSIIINLLGAGLFCELNAHSPHDVIRALSLSPKFADDKTMYIIVFNELKRSIDGGLTWKVLENGLDNKSCNYSDIAVSSGSKNNNHVFVSTIGDGIYRSIDGGENWKAIIKGLQAISK